MLQTFGPFTGYILASYAVTAAVLIGLVVVSLRYRTAAERRLAAFDVKHSGADDHPGGGRER